LLARLEQVDRQNEMIARRQASESTSPLPWDPPKIDGTFHRLAILTPKLESKVNTVGRFNLNEPTIDSAFGEAYRCGEFKNGKPVEPSTSTTAAANIMINANN
jgi:hypothetical protein